MKHRSALAALCMAAALGMPASAAAQMGMSSAYVGGSLGQSEVKDACEGLPLNASCDEKDNAWRIFGGFQLTPMFGVELGYADLGEVSGSAAGISASVETTAWDLSILAGFALAERLSLFGRLGGYRADFEGRSNIGVSLDDSNNGVTFGFGAGYQLTQNLGLRAEWQRYVDVGEDEDESDIDVLSVGVLWRF